MKLIRNSVFETNSSSTHSISLSDNMVYDGLEPNEDGVIEIYPHEFGWEIAAYDDALTKLTYMWLYVHDCEGGAVGELDDHHKSLLDILTKVVTEHTGASSILMKRNDDTWCPYGYIDHQSIEDKQLDWMFEDPQTLKNFIFNRDSVLYTDNDNH